MLLLFFLFIIIAALLLQKASLKDQLLYISYDCRPDRFQVEPGQAFTIVTTVTNKRRLPVFFLGLEEHLPADAAIEGEGLAIRREDDYLRLTNTVFLMPKEVLTRSIKASLPKRGRYLFRGAYIYAGDFLGLEERYTSFPLTREIVVYPAPSKERYFYPVIGSLFGEQSARRFLLEDPILSSGFREYTGREPQRYISWPQSLARGRLMVRQFDHTQDLSVAILLNTDCGGYDRQEPTLIEEAFSMTRSVCEVLEEKKVRYSFLTNASTAGATGQWSYVASGLGPRHFFTIMEGLGRATYDYGEPCGSLFYRAEKRTEHSQAFIVVTTRWTQSLQAMIQRLEVVSGCTVYLLDAWSGAGASATAAAGVGVGVGVSADATTNAGAGVGVGASAGATAATGVSPAAGASREPYAVREVESA
ncbi:MAG: DUF58 domain-containing protein [Clostridiales bacterium]|nr:DUF58 domain-containing protein [Clostridiales bacterium]